MVLSAGTNGTLRESFAKVAAMTPRQLSRPEVSASSISSMENGDQSSTTNTSLSSVPNNGQPGAKLAKANTHSSASQSRQTGKLQSVAQDLGAIQFREEGLDEAAKSSDSGMDPQPQDRREPACPVDALSVSMSALSTKPSSVDGKSTTSAITFAMDEKESLRPDDSASAKAPDDEEFFTAGGSGATGSRFGSEQGSRLPFVSVQSFLPQPQVSPPSYVPSVPQGGVLPTADPAMLTSSIVNSAMASFTDPVGGTPFGYRELVPDAKLLDALRNPKDRLFVLRIEQDVIHFIKNTTDPALELPPCNSYCRLLIHKLAEYYDLSHFVDNSTNSVRLHRTPYCKLSPPLNSMTTAPDTENAVPLSGPAVKIMRRGKLGRDGSRADARRGSPLDSEKPSQPASELDDDTETGDIPDTGGVNGKDKSSMTREQREAKYKEARERIFKGFEETEVEEGNAVADQFKQTSRSSSGAGQNKSAARKTREANDDGFDPRSKFAPFYPSQPQYQSYPGMVPYGVHPGQGPAISSTLAPAASAPGYQAFGHGFAQQVSPQPFGSYTSSPHAIHAGNHGPDSNQPYSTAFVHGVTPGMPPYVSQSMYGGPGYNNVSYPPTTSFSDPANAFRPMPSHPQAPNGAWSPQSHHAHGIPAAHPSANPFPAQVMVDNRTGSPLPYGSYPYGPPPSQAHPHHGQWLNHHHPVPGSFNRHAFNPRTQPFVPGSMAFPGQSGTHGGPPPTGFPTGPAYSGYAFSPPNSTERSSHYTTPSRTAVMPPAQFPPHYEGKPMPAMRGSPAMSAASYDPIRSQPPQPYPSTLARVHGLPAKPPVSHALTFPLAHGNSRALQGSGPPHLRGPDFSLEKGRGPAAGSAQ